MLVEAGVEWKALNDVDGKEKENYVKAFQKYDKWHRVIIRTGLA